MIKPLFYSIDKDKFPGWLFACVFIVYLIVAYNNTGFNNPDEHFQIIEFANYKLGLAMESDLAWEYKLNYT